ncbi:MAG: bifunctional acetate--CoA ligase family protein/GNAT family N-acetyltransferase [Deltaproteobacteria bacterium]|nr:bifunctional acetate--CoA ligase family protein/GNAT family N-acetyltransferase [Candidatus Anaeroferrophillus wilburensis]MBN2888403.1 bifunctional acetate--CoA ligase family protein/GNAT family N-acetyltransferase [Deltaproteobacteria bacterium]
MSTRKLSQLFDPRCIAVIADFCPGSYKEQLLTANLSRLNGGRSVYFVGAPCLPTDVKGITADSLEQINQPIDILIVALPLTTVPEIFRAQNISTVASIILLGFAEKIQTALLDDILSQAGRHQIRILGANSIGLLIPRLNLNASYHSTMPHQGRIALVSQSGALITSILDIARERNIGFSHVVSIGSLADIDFGDLIDYLGGDDQVGSIALYMENIGSVKKFLSACRSTARVKPIIVLKSGRHPMIQSLIERRNADHLGSDAVYDSAFRRAGVIMVDTINELLTAGITLSTSHIPFGNRFALITNSGALGLFALDQLLSRQLAPAAIQPPLQQKLTELLPEKSDENPIDVGATADNDCFSATIAACLESGNVDALIVLMVINGFMEPHTIVDQVQKNGERFPGKIFYAWLGGSPFHRYKARNFMQADIPIYFTLEEALSAYYYSERYRYKLAKLMAIPPQFDDASPTHQARVRQIVAPHLAPEPAPLPETVVRELLQTYGITVTSQTLPVAGVELALSCRWDPEFGPYFSLGISGFCSRFNSRTAIMLPPLNSLQAQRLIERSPAADILASYPLTRLEDLLLRFSALICDFAEIRQAKLVLTVRETGDVATTNASIMASYTATIAPHHLVIMPYPHQYQFFATLADGTRLLIRPIKPEDEEKHFAFFHSLSRQTNYYRFFSYRKKLSHEQISRFTQIDYDREMAIIALVEENGVDTTIGVNRLAYYPQDDRHEFALVITDAWQGKGVGKVLMERLLEIAKDRQIRTIYGKVLAENQTMIGFCRRFGFSEYESEGNVILVKLELDGGPDAKE